MSDPSAWIEVSSATRDSRSRLVSADIRTDAATRPATQPSTRSSGRDPGPLLLSTVRSAKASG